MLPRVHFIETTMMRTLKPILANSKTLLKDMLMNIMTVNELTLLLQKTAFSLLYKNYQNFHPLIFYGYTRLRGVGADLPHPG